MPALGPEDQRARVAGAGAARLATLRPDGTPRLVPITFALVDGLLCSAVDMVKSKTSTRLTRLADVADDPREPSRRWWRSTSPTPPHPRTGRCSS